MRAVELFAGAGGLGMGLSRAGFHPVAVIERDRYCCDTIRENKKRGLKPLTSWPLVEGDIRDFDFRGIGGEIDLVYVDQADRDQASYAPLVAFLQKHLASPA